MYNFRIIYKLKYNNLEKKDIVIITTFNAARLSYIYKLWSPCHSTLFSDQLIISRLLGDIITFKS